MLDIIRDFGQAAKNDPVVKAWCYATTASSAFTIAAGLTMGPMYTIPGVITTAYNAWSAGAQYLIRKHYDGEPPPNETPEEWREKIQEMWESRYGQRKP